MYWQHGSGACAEGVEAFGTRRLAEKWDIYTTTILTLAFDLLLRLARIACLSFRVMSPILACRCGCGVGGS